MASARKIGSTWLLITGILVTLLGVLHVALTPYVYGMGWNELPAAEGRVFVYMYVAAGLALAFAGVLTIRSARALGRGEKWGYGVATLAGWFVILMGVGAVLNMRSDPFAWSALAVAILNYIPLAGYRRAFRG
jgi:hypothetical protein